MISKNYLKFIVDSSDLIYVYEKRLKHKSPRTGLASDLRYGCGINYTKGGLYTTDTGVNNIETTIGTTYILLNLQIFH